MAKCKTCGQDVPVTIPTLLEYLRRNEARAKKNVVWHEEKLSETRSSLYALQRTKRRDSARKALTKWKQWADEVEALIKSQTQKEK